MKTSRCLWLPGLAALLALAPDAPAQDKSRTMSVGYVYPAGAQQGTTSEHVIAGQFLTGVTNVYVSGGGITAALDDFIHPISGRELNDVRIKVDEMMARKAVVQKNFKALENFRSFKNTKDIKSNADEDEELAALKKKYAGATWTKEDDTQLAELRKKMSSGVRRPANPAICELVVCRLTVAPDAKPGRRELRVATPFGLSNPVAFFVGQVPEFSEAASKDISEQRSAIAKTGFAPKSTKAKAEKTITLPAVVNGQILPGEVDRFRFAGTKGQKLVVSAGARAVIPYISDAVPGWFQATLSLYDATGNELAYTDDFRFDPDPVINYTIPADGEYVIEIKDSIYRGREDFVYRVTIGETPFITSVFPLGGPTGARAAIQIKGWNLPGSSLAVDNKDKPPGIYPIQVRKGPFVSNQVPFIVDDLPECVETEPARGEPAVQQVSLPIVVNGRIDRPDDTDSFAFEGKAGQSIVAEVMARRLNSPLDSILRLIDPQGKEVSFNDDNTDRAAGLTTHHADSYLRVTLPKDGTYRLNLDDAQHKGGPDYGYRLRISEPRPDFALRVVPSTISARAGSTVPVTVYALRKDGFDGEIAIELKDPSAGFSLTGGKVPAKEDKVKVTLTAPPSGEGQPFTIAFEGRASIGGREIVHVAVPAEDRMQAFEYRHLVPVDDLMVAVAGRSSSKEGGRSGTPLKLVSTTPVKIPAGGSATIRIAAAYSGFASKARLELSDAPDGIAIKNVVPSGDGMDVEIGSDAAKVQAGQKGNLVVSAYPSKTSPSKKPKGASASKERSLTMPAIPFEITRN